MIKYAALLALWATHATAADETQCFNLGQVSEKIVALRDSGVPESTAISYIPLEIPMETYIFWMQITMKVYREWRYVPSIDVGATVFTACMTADN